MGMGGQGSGAGKDELQGNETHGLSPFALIRTFLLLIPNPWPPAP